MPPIPTSTPTRWPYGSSPAAPPASPRPPCCATGTWCPTCSRPSSSCAPARTRRRSSASRPTTSPAWRPCCRRPAGRRIVYLPQFDPDDWRLATEEAVTTPWWSPRCWEDCSTRWSGAAPRPSLRHLSYGGGRMPVAVVEQAMDQLPHVGFVNAYGLTEASSTASRCWARRPSDRGSDDDPPSVSGSARSVCRCRRSSSRSVTPWVGPSARHDRRNPRSGRADRRRVSGPQRPHPRRLVPHQRLRVPRRRPFFVEGRLDDVIVRGGERVARRGRGRAAPAPCGGRGGRDRDPGRRVGRWPPPPSCSSPGRPPRRPSCRHGCGNGCDPRGLGRWTCVLALVQRDRQAPAAGVEGRARSPGNLGVDGDLTAGAAGPTPPGLSRRQVKHRGQGPHARQPGVGIATLGVRSRRAGRPPFRTPRTGPGSHWVHGVAVPGHAQRDRMRRRAARRGAARPAPWRPPDRRRRRGSRRLWWSPARRRRRSSAHPTGMSLRLRQNPHVAERVEPAVVAGSSRQAVRNRSMISSRRAPRWSKGRAAPRTLPPTTRCRRPR